jgi:anti-sigma regulatory factor (Ser/Thr protein kinase)
VDRVRAFLQESLASLEPREDDFFKIELAVVELCVNISRYAYPDGPGEMAVEIEMSDRTATVTITDEGIPFDPRAVPKPDVSWILATGRTGGLGIYLARTLTDRFDYRREDGRNVLTLAKKF